jgi:VWFA-related protein
LIRTQPDTARTLIIKLSGLLRRLMRSTDHFVTLREELESVDEYLEIEVVRFGPQLRVDSDLVLVPVSVVDQRNHPVTGLERDHFRIFDDGVERTITSFATDDEPVALGLILDISSSVSGLRPNEAETARLFLKTAQPEEEYFLVVFASRPELAVPLTSGNEEVRYRVLTTKWGGATALYDGVILGLDELKKSQLHRKALLVISDGGENNSRYSQKELKRILEESNALIYTVGFASRQSNFPFMKWMAEVSGGMAIPAQAESLPDVAAKVALEVRNRYVLGFSAGDVANDGKVHRLRVQLQGMPALKVSWRRSYRAPGR